MVMPFFDWKLWLVIHRARREVGRISRRVVPSARVFIYRGAGLASPRWLVVWVATRTDAERDYLLQDKSLDQQFRNALIRTGYPAGAGRVRFVVQSQETVDRDYGGSWREAKEMP
jgi:hypothetical protein